MTSIASEQGTGYARYGVSLRRLYLYLVAFVSLVALLSRFQGLAVDLATFWGSQEDHFLVPTYEHINRRMLEQGSFLLTAALFLVVHYGLILGLVRRDPQELNSPLRKLFLLASTAAALTFSGQLVARILSLALEQLLGSNPLSVGFQWAVATALAISLCLSATFLIQGSSLLYAERNKGTPASRCQAMEAFFFALAGAVALLMLVSVTHVFLFRTGIPLLLDALPRSIVPSTGKAAAAALSSFLTLLLVLHLVNGCRIGLRQGQPHLWGNVLHSMFLYGGKLTGLVLVLFGLLLFLQTLLGYINENSFEGFETWPRLGSALGSISLLGAAIWWRFQRELSADPESTFLGRWHNVPRQLFLYSGAGIALFWVAAGSYEVIRFFMDGGPFSTSERFDWTDISPMLIGGPMLGLLWRQVRQLGLEQVDAANLNLHLMPRRLYLFGITIVSSLALLFVMGRVLQDLLTRLLGWQAWSLISDGDFSHDVSLLIVLAVISVFHVRLLRLAWGPAQTDRSQTAESATNLREELACAYQQQQQITEHIETLKKQLSELSPITSSEGRET